MLVHLHTTKQEFEIVAELVEGLVVEADSTVVVVVVGIVEPAAAGMLAADRQAAAAAAGELVDILAAEFRIVGHTGAVVVVVGTFVADTA